MIKKQSFNLTKLFFHAVAPKVVPDPPVVAQVVGYMRTLVCIVEANPPPKTDLEIDNPQLRFVKDGQTVIPDERYL